MFNRKNSKKKVPNVLYIFVCIVFLALLTTLLHYYNEFKKWVTLKPIVIIYLVNIQTFNPSI